MRDALNVVVTSWGFLTAACRPRAANQPGNSRRRPHLAGRTLLATVLSCMRQDSLSSDTGWQSPHPHSPSMDDTPPHTHTLRVMPPTWVTSVLSCMGPTLSAQIPAGTTPLLPSEPPPPPSLFIPPTLLASVLSRMGPDFLISATSWDPTPASPHPPPGSCHPPCLPVY